MMATPKFFFAISLLSLLISSALAIQTPRLSAAQQCRFQRISVSQPNQRIEHEAGITEMWDDNEEQFQCAGVSANRNVLQPNALSLPNFHPTPRLVYIQQGQGLLGVSFPGCAEEFHSHPEAYEGRIREGRGQEGRGEQSQGGRRQEGRGEQSHGGRRQEGRGDQSHGGRRQEGRGEQSHGGRRQEGRGEQSQGGRRQEGRGDQSQGGRLEQHQKIHRIRQGDIVALPAGVAHWTFNDGNEELVAISVNDLNHQTNQLDQKFRAFYLAGGPPRGGQQRGQQRGEQRGREERGQRGGEFEETFQNILSAFDTELLAEAYNVQPEIVSQMQSEDGRGLIVDAQEMRGVLRPEEEEEGGRRAVAAAANGYEEGFCDMKIKSNIENRREADIYSRQAGKLHYVNRQTLPILSYLDMSAEKGKLYPNAMLSPHWSVSGHGIVYVTRGEADVQIVDNRGQTVLNDRVREGDMFVIPQYFTSTFRAERQGFEWLSFKTTGEAMNSPLVGYTSVMRAMPLQVLSNAYQISPREAEGLKTNRGGQSFLLSPGRSS